MTDAVPQPQLAVADLRVDVRSGATILEDATFSLRAGEILGVVGESGSGKTTLGLALLGYARRGCRLVRGSVDVGGVNLLALDRRALRRLRGRTVSYVPQDPSTALNPCLRIADHARDVLGSRGREAQSAIAVEAVFARLGLPVTREFTRRYPHQLSGGQQQRVVIALAVASRPQVLVLDEPTTGLDVVTQAQILTEVDGLAKDLAAAVIYISHDLAVVSQIADHIAVMYAGEIVEIASVAGLVSNPLHPYTRGLLEAVPDLHVGHPLRGIPGIVPGISDRPPGCIFAPRCLQSLPDCLPARPPLTRLGPERVVRCINPGFSPADSRANRTHEPVLESIDQPPVFRAVNLSAYYPTRNGRHAAVTGVSFEIASGDCLAIVGESGSGKTTLGRCLVGLHPDAAGTLLLGDQSLSLHAKGRSQEERRRIQIVFQNPTDSLNPRQRVKDQIARPASLLRGLSRADCQTEVRTLLERVRLPYVSADRFPSELSGGERQRVAIARALAAKPDLLICDEVTSALDVSVQAAVLALLSDLRDELGLAILFISHDLGVVSSVSRKVLVLKNGEVCDEGHVRAILDRPSHPYTRSLLEAAPTLRRARNSSLNPA